LYSRRQDVASLFFQQFLQPRFGEGIGISFDDHRIIGLDEHLSF
jgi:hypothetical protein